MWERRWLETRLLSAVGCRRRGQFTQRWFSICHQIGQGLCPFAASGIKLGLHSEVFLVRLVSGGANDTHRGNFGEEPDTEIPLGFHVETPPRMAPSTLDFKLVIFWLKSVFSHPSTAQTYVIRFTQTTAYFCKQNISSSYCLCFSELWLLHAKSEGDVRQCQASNYPNLGIGMEVFNCPKKKDCFWMFVIMISRVIPFE